MKKTTTISWILLAIAFASQKSPAGRKEISEIADGINHAVPTNRELEESIKWLIQNGIISEANKKFSLSDYGEKLVNNANSKTNIIFEIWKNLETEINEKLKDE
ncbi:hypothetical protein [Mangrovibacterium diazotrophicum]|uniref:hypothetical protein n=1 Tax=Mangrovibacterium diazotrophicum TaxID=1261403 RepID=UPI000E74E1D0|nr:hypothetical protein [Mangrovibacterium diazotrophicum]